MDLSAWLSASCWPVKNSTYMYMHKADFCWYEMLFMSLFFGLYYSMAFPIPFFFSLLAFSCRSHICHTVRPTSRTVKLDQPMEEWCVVTQKRSLCLLLEFYDYTYSYCVQIISFTLWGPGRSNLGVETSWGKVCHNPKGGHFASFWNFMAIQLCPSKAPSSLVCRWIFGWTCVIIQK